MKGVRLVPTDLCTTCVDFAFRSLFAFVCQLTNMLSNRNIPGLQIVCMKACLTYSGKKDGTYFYGITEVHANVF